MILSDFPIVLSKSFIERKNKNTIAPCYFVLLLLEYSNCETLYLLPNKHFLFSITFNKFLQFDEFFPFSPSKECCENNIKHHQKSESTAFGHQ